MIREIENYKRYERVNVGNMYTKSIASDESERVFVYSLSKIPNSSSRVIKAKDMLCGDRDLVMKEEEFIKNFPLRIHTTFTK